MTVSKELRTWVLVGILFVLTIGIVWVLASNRSPRSSIGKPAVDTAADYATADLAQFFADITNGYTRATLTDLLDHPQACLAKIQLTEGSQEVCSWHNSQVSIVVVFLNDQVIAKTKVGL